MANLKKAFLLFIVLSLVATSLFAGGSKEEVSIPVESQDGKTTVELHSISELMARSPTTSSGMLYSIANVYDEITMAFCLGLTPFPNTLVQFYGGYMPDENYDAQAKADAAQLNTTLLLGDDYYTMADGGTLSYGAREYQGKSGETQRGIWNMITILFISFLLAEIVFTAIYHYVADKEGSVIKEIIAKVILSMAIFLIASALPMIIELFRIGFTSAAATLTGLDEKIVEANEELEGTNGPQSIDEILESDMPVMSTSAWQSLIEMKSLPVFNYPGTLIRSVADVFSFINPDDIGGTGISLAEEVNDKADENTNILLRGFTKIGNFIVGKLFDIVYLIIKLIASLMVLIAALHIMYNVCEVYLLLGCVMLLLPFTIFSPLKFLGEKAVMSLFANVLELFVIVMIMFATLSVASTVTTGLLSAILSNVKSVTADISIGNTDAFCEEMGYSLDYYKNLFDSIQEGDGTVRFTAYLLGTDSEYISDIFQESLYGVDAAEQISGIITNFAFWISEQWDAMLQKNETNMDPDFYSWVKTVKFAWDNAGCPEEDFLPTLMTAGFEQLPARDKYAVVTAIANNAGTKFGMSVSKTPTVDRGIDPSLGTMDIYFMHIISFLLIILMQTYFINQSSQITNALLSGNVSSEGFTGALTRIAGTKALKAAGKAAATPAKALGGLGRFGLGAYGAKHEGTKRGAFANFAAGDRMQDLTKNLFNQGGGGKEVGKS